MLRGSLFKLL